MSEEYERIVCDQANILVRLYRCGMEDRFRFWRAILTQLLGEMGPACFLNFARDAAQNSIADNHKSFRSNGVYQLAAFGVEIESLAEDFEKTILALKDCPQPHDEFSQERLDILHAWKPRDKVEKFFTEALEAASDASSDST